MPRPLPANPPIQAPWWRSLAVYTEPAALRMLALGFSAGLPLLLVLGTLSFWLREAGIDRATIGYLSWVGLAYAFKWLWAPVVDRVPLPLLTRALGRRRSWLLASQLVIAAGLVGMAFNDPRIALAPVVWCALAVAIGSATQDIALDAFRIESAGVDRQAALAASYQAGYRIAMIWAGAGVLWLAARAEVPGAAAYQPLAWRVAYLAMAASMVVGVATVLLSREPAPLDAAADRAQRAEVAQAMAIRGIACPWPQALALAGVAGLLASMVALAAASGAWPRWLASAAALAATVGFVGLDRGWGRTRPLHWHRIAPGMAAVLAWLHQAVYQPFADFLQRFGRQAVVVLALIALYRISDIVMGIMANPFYVDMGFTKDEVAAVTKVYGVAMTLLGAFAGGALALRFGVMRVLMLGAVLSAASNLLFAWLATRGHDVAGLVFVVSADNLAGGIASAAFIAYLSGLTNVRYSATQYALFSSMMLLAPKWLAGFSGGWVNTYGYAQFFSATALLGLPVLALVAWAAHAARGPGGQRAVPGDPIQAK